ncbi:hypothetical protein K6T13_03110 [Nocardioides coralli]|nr:hypothetical protein [Nocardioides coralli]QZY29697.1 hypothetical protein K6T13_03110 [Nocardioides coralli]
MVDDPTRIARAFASVIEVGEVLEIEPGRFLTFEYIGPTDFFGESVTGSRTRGARCTSVDAAFLHRTPDGVVELVLVEWKYTESYGQRKPDRRRDEVRAGRYKPFVEDPSGPVRSDVLPFELLLDEPFYQLVRQQLLAHELERAGAEGAQRVRVVHVLPRGNDAYQASLTRPEHRALGASVSEVWQRLIRVPDRFASLDASAFHDPAVTSREYALRYGNRAAHDRRGLLEAMGADDDSGVEDRLYVDVDFDGDVQLHQDGVELIVGRAGTFVAYPFLIEELFELAPQLAAEAEQLARDD